MAAKIPKQVSLFHFTCIGEDIWQCKCTQKRKQIANKGYSNLNSHIAVVHPNWKDENGSSQKLGFSAVVPSQKVSRKGTNIFRWLEWVTMESLPFSFYERELVRQNSVLEPISTDTFVRYVDLTVEKVEGKLAELLPDKFVLIERDTQIEDVAEESESFAEDLLLAKNRKTEAEYVSLVFITGTSNICERLFSKGKLTLGMLRQNLSPMHLEAFPFLRINRKLWDAELISTLL